MTAPSPNDWRRQGQERYLSRARLDFARYACFRPGWDHDHCEFCGRKFSLVAGDLNEGYATPDRYRWVCQDCFEDFREEFGWQVTANSPT